MCTVKIAEMLAIEESAFANGWTEEQLINLAGERLGRALGRYFPSPGTVVGYLGKGHNAGDALVALRVLREEFGWKIATRNAYPLGECIPLMRKKWDELGIPVPMDRSPDWRDFEGPLILLDGLLGSGAAGPLREPLLHLAHEMASLRETAGAKVASIDLPSGIDPDSGQILPNAVVANITFMIGSAKVGLLKGHACNATGALALVPVEPLTRSRITDDTLISPQTLDWGKRHRPFDFHKGMAGRVTILAGSLDYSGAAVLAAMGALRGGAGLVTLFVPKIARKLIASKCPPEIIVRDFYNPKELIEERFDALVVGCGLKDLDGETAEGLLELIANSRNPSVIDAEALNLIAKKGKLGLLTDKHILTPHQGEFSRLVPDLVGLAREDAARLFANRVPSTLLLKGSRTIVTRRDLPVFYNSTGNPAMATGGLGDVLAGVIAAFLANKTSPVEAACLSAWICGRAAEIAMNQPNISEESLLPSDVLHFLGAAFVDWKTSRR